MGNTLFIDACVRKEESRTLRLAESFIKAYGEKVDRLTLTEEPLHYFVGDFFWQRERLLEEGQRDHPRFRYAHQFAQAEKIIVAAPFWDLTFPAILKVYFENVSVDGITFYADEEGCHGMSQGKKLLYITTRGGSYKGSPLEMGIPTMRALTEFFGIDEFLYVAVDGLDEEDKDPEALLDTAEKELKSIAKKF